jgi:hypothetical protein
VHADLVILERVYGLAMPVRFFRVRYSEQGPKCRAKWMMGEQVNGVNTSRMMREQKHSQA